jgi:hypothetical protein
MGVLAMRYHGLILAVLMLGCVCSRGLSAEEQKPVAAGASLVVWHNAEKDYGWLVIDKGYRLISCAVIISDKDSIRYFSSRNTEAEKLIVEVELAPVSVRIAASTSGYAVRISRRGLTVGIADIKSRMIYENESGVFMASGTVVDEKFVKEIEAISESNFTVDWLKNSVQEKKIEIVEIINAAERQKGQKSIP